MNSSKLLRVAGGVAALLIGCAAIYVYAAHQAGRSELRALCEKGVHPKIYREASAPGYFDGGISCIANGCWDVLIRSGYRFIEFEKRGAKKWEPISEDGFYRVSRARQDSGQCDATLLADMKKSVGYAEFLEEGNCLALERIGGVEARYGIFTEKLPITTVNNWFRSRIGTRRMEITEISSEQLVADQTSYLLFIDMVPSFSSFRNVIGCKGIGVTDANPDINFVEHYIKPE